MGRMPAEILRDTKTIAVVGASPNPNRPSHGVMRYLLQVGYRCIPVRPPASLATSASGRGSFAPASVGAADPGRMDPRAQRPDCNEVLGVPCVASLAEIEEPIDLVDVFRRAEFCADVAREAAAVGAKALWLQLGIVSPEARIVARDSGMDYVEDACTLVVHRRELR